MSRSSQSRHVLAGLADLRAQLAHALEVLARCATASKPAAFGVPVERLDLPPAQSPTSESPWRSAWSTNVNACSLASVTSQSDIFARSTATGFLSTP